MNIQGLNPTEVSNLPYLLGKDANDKSVSWSEVPANTAYTVMIAKLVQKKDGYQGQSFISAEGVYLPNTITDVSQVATQAMKVTIPLSTVITRAIIDDQSVKMGDVVRITCLGKVNAKGQAVNYVNFKIETYNSPELNAEAEKVWGSLVEANVYSLTPDTVKGGELLVTNGAMAQQPVAPAPVAPAPVAPAPVAPALTIPQG